jgi:tRNA threonylcarbamoyl adenosine modification protein YeaZ
MKILALEFSSPVRGVAVSIDGALRGQAEERGGRSTHVFGLIDAALRESGLRREEIECIAVGTGPGSYAGIRTAIAIAQGWQLALGINLLGISSADSLAAHATETGAKKFFYVGIDAQREEVFLARYEVTASGARIVAPFHCADDADWGRIAGGETCYRPDLLETDELGMIALPPPAAALARLASGRSDFIAGFALEPIYLRRAEFVKAPPPKFGVI